MITIYGELYSSKNSKQIVRAGGRFILLPSKACREHRKPLEQQLVLNRGKWLNEIKNASMPFKISFKIYRQTHRRFDYVNIIQYVLDSMTACGWIPDDNADVILPVFEQYEVDPKNPRVEIKLLTNG